MPKQINGVDIGEFRRQLEVMDNCCPSEFGMSDTERPCANTDYLDCWINAINKEETTNAKTETSQTT